MSELDLLVSLDRARPVRAQLEDQLRVAVRAGRLAPRTALPSSRGLARELGISRGVVVDAYAQLAAEGYLVTHRGAATRVAETSSPAAGAPDEPSAERAPRFDFRPGGPDVSLFPRPAWLASLRRALREAPDARLDYGDPRGAPELRDTLARYLGRVRGAACDRERLVITSGMAQGMALVGRALIAQERGRIGLEDPGTGPGRDQLAATGLEVVPFPVDGEGLRVDLLEGVDAVMVTPAHQFPLGVVLSPERRAALVEWAIETGALVLEDDYDSEYRHDRAPVGVLQGLAPEHVALAGSVSKTLAPGLRLGWIAPPQQIATEVIAAKQRDDLGTPVVEQHALADFIERGELDRHLRRTRVVYRRRRDALVAALARHLPGCLPEGVAAGLHLIVRLPPRGRRASAARAGARPGHRAVGLVRHAVRPAGRALLLGYGRIAEPGHRTRCARTRGGAETALRGASGRRR